MDVERALVAKLVRTGAVETTMGLGIEETHFDDPNGDPAKVYRWMVDHVRKYRSAPSIDAFKKQFPDYTLDSVSDSMEYIVDEFVTRTKRREAIKRLEDLATIVDDPVRVKEIEEEFLAAARDMSRVIPGSHASKFSDMEKRIDMYLARKAQENPMGIPFGIKRFDELTFGVQPHELIGIVGWQGTGKSTLLQHFMFNAYVAGYTPMIISLEMEDEALYRKWDVMATQLEYRALKALELNPADEKKWTEAAERAKNAKNDIIVIDNVNPEQLIVLRSAMADYRQSLSGRRG
jgi:replicative DNA helicase